MPPIGLFSALADETRCTIITMLHKGPLPVHKLAAAFDISRPAISRHLRVLGEAGLVRERKKGRENIYELKLAPFGKGQKWIAEFLPAKAAAKLVEAEVEAEVEAVAEIAPVPQPLPEPVAAPVVVPEPQPEPAPLPVVEPVAAKPARQPKPKPVKQDLPENQQFQMAFDL